MIVSVCFECNCGKTRPREISTAGSFSFDGDSKRLNSILIYLMAVLSNRAACFEGIWSHLVGKTVGSDLQVLQNRHTIPTDDFKCIKVDRQRGEYCRL